MYAFKHKTISPFLYIKSCMLLILQLGKAATKNVCIFFLWGGVMYDRFIMSISGSC